MNLMQQLFFGMTREEIDLATSGWSIPNEVMTAVFMALSPQKHEIGIGHGPTLEDVINHYMNEYAYGKLRLLPDDLLQHMLDKAMQYTDVGAWNDTTRFKVASLRYHMDLYNVGQFKFMNSPYYHETIAPHLRFVVSKLKSALPFIKELDNV